MKAIVYTSNTGTTKAYAELLSQATGLPAYALKECSGKLEKGATVLYMGWLMAGSVKGYRKAAKAYSVCAVCGVGMAKSGTQIDDVRKANHIADTPVFTLQGGYRKDKLRGVYKFMMRIVESSSVKGLEQKPDKTDDEKEMLQLMREGGTLVRAENLRPVLNWLASQA